MAVQAIVINLVKRKIIDWIQEKYPGGVIGLVASVVIVYVTVQYFLFTMVIYSALSGASSKSIEMCKSPDISFLDSYSDAEIEAMSDDDFNKLIDVSFNSYYQAQITYSVPPIPLTTADTQLAMAHPLTGASSLIYPIPKNTGVIHSLNNSALRVTPTSKNDVLAPADSMVLEIGETPEYGGYIIFKINGASAGEGALYSNVYIEYSRLDPSSIQPQNGDAVKSGDFVGKIPNSVGTAEKGNHLRVMVYTSDSDFSERQSLGDTTTWYTISQASWYTDTSGSPASGEGFSGGGAECELVSGMGGIGAVGDGKGAVGAWGGFSNGQIPANALISITPKERLAPKAAQAFIAMDAYYYATTGRHIVVNDGYRDYASQVAQKKISGAMAATPGTSMHGWGQAVDLSVGGFGSSTYAWLSANAPSFGFINPSWARPGAGKEEPWHWEYVHSPI